MEIEDKNMIKLIKRISLLLLGIFLLCHLSIYIFAEIFYSTRKPNDYKKFEKGIDITLNSESGEKIRGRLIKNNLEKPYILLLHGINSSMQVMFSRADFLSRAGFNILMIDFQSHGASSGEQVTFGYKERYDVNASIEYLKSIGAKKIGVIAASMGGASFLLSKSMNKVNGVVLESVYSDIYTTMNNRVKLVVGPFSTLVTPLMLQQLNIRLGLSNSDLNPAVRIKDLNVPAFIISGSEDRYTIPEETQLMFKNKDGEKKIYIVKGAAHESMHNFLKSEYELKILDFFEEIFH